MANFVPGIGPRPDRMVLAQLFAYSDSNRYRTGASYEPLPVNRPINEVHNYTKNSARSKTTCPRSIPIWERGWPKASV
jgi:catalase